MFENMSYEGILQRMLDRVPNTFDKREGSIIFDALAPAAMEMIVSNSEMWHRVLCCIHCLTTPTCI